MRGFLWLEWRWIWPWLCFLAAAAFLLPLIGYVWPLIFGTGRVFPPPRPDPELGQAVGSILGIASLVFYFLLRNWRRGKLPEVLFLSPYHDLAGLVAQFIAPAAAWTSYIVTLAVWNALLARLWLSIPYNLFLSLQSGLYFGSFSFIPLSGWLVLFERFVWRFRLHRRSVPAMVAFLAGSASMSWLLVGGISRIAGELLPEWMIWQTRWPEGVQVSGVPQEPLWAMLSLTVVFLGWAWAIGREVEL